MHICGDPTAIAQHIRGRISGRPPCDRTRWRLWCGTFHVCMALAPLEGIGPEDLALTPVERVKSEGTREVVLG